MKLLTDQRFGQWESAKIVYDWHTPTSGEVFIEYVPIAPVERITFKVRRESPNAMAAAFADLCRALEAEGTELLP